MIGTRDDPGRTGVGRIERILRVINSNTQSRTHPCESNPLPGELRPVDGAVVLGNIHALDAPGIGKTTGERNDEKQEPGLEVRQRDSFFYLLVYSAIARF